MGSQSETSRLYARLISNTGISDVSSRFASLGCDPGVDSNSSSDQQTNRRCPTMRANFLLAGDRDGIRFGSFREIRFDGAELLPVSSLPSLAGPLATLTGLIWR